MIKALKALKDAAKEIRKALGNDIYVGIDWQGDINIHVGSLQGLKQIPGEICLLERNSEEYPVEAQKKYLDICFFCLLKEEK